MNSQTNDIILRPVEIYIEDLEKIFEIVNTKYKNENLVIQTDNYYYKDFEELSRSPEDFVYKLKIETKNKKGFVLNFRDNIYLKTYQEDDLGLIHKIKNLLSEKKLLKSSLPYYLIKYNKIWFNIFVFGVPILFLLFIPNFSNYLFIFFIGIILYTIMFRNYYKKNSERILYSTIILYSRLKISKKEIVLKKNKVPRYKIFLEVLKVLIPLIAVIINYLIVIFKK